VRDGIGFWRPHRSVRPFFIAQAQGAIGDGAGYVALLLLAYDRIGSAWAATALMLADFGPAMLLGPALGALVLSRGGYSWLMWTASGVFLASALTVLLVPRPGPAATAASSPGSIPVLLTGSVALFFTATFAGGLALPLFVTRALHQRPASVGVLFSVCAAVEVVATLGLAAVPTRVGQRALILGGFGSFVCYYALTGVSPDLLWLVVAQVFRGVGIAVVAGAGIRYFQDLLAPAAGRATTLFANACTAGFLVSGILGGVAVERFGYRTTLLLCGVTAAAGGAAFALGSRHDDGTFDPGSPATLPSG